MELSLQTSIDGAVRIDTLGKITRDGWPPHYDPLVECYGSNEIYSQRLLLNLENSGHIDSTGVEWLLEANKKFNQNSGVMVLHSAKPMITELLKMMRMHLVLHIASDEMEARHKLESSSQT
ncbi:MAG: STAS domain-containing protein [Pirellulaceae bacterium]